MSTGNPLSQRLVSQKKGTVAGVAGTGPKISPDERESLLRTARSRQASQGVATRARLVVDCAELGIAEAARRSSVSRTTAAKWLQRYLAAGIGGLDDAPRTGRPPAPDDVVRHILRCTLDEPPPGARRWTTRTIAEAVGASQATVSRVRRRSFSSLDPGAADLPDLSASLVAYVDAHPTGCALGLLPTTGAVPRTSPAPAALLDVIETIVCAALLSRPVPGRTMTGSEKPDATAVLRRAAARLPSAGTVTLVVDVELDASARQWLSRHPGITAHSVAGEGWLALLHRVADVVHPGQLAELREVQRLVRRARREGAGELVWVRAQVPPRPSTRPRLPAHPPSRRPSPHRETTCRSFAASAPPSTKVSCTRAMPSP